MPTKVAEIKKFREHFPHEPNRIVTISVSATAREALSLMTEQKVHHLVVMDGSQLIGTLTDRDLFFQLFKSSVTGVLETNEFPIKNAVRQGTPYITAETTLEQAVTWMNEKGLSVLLSLEGNKVVGVLTESDLLRATHTFWAKKHILKELYEEGESAIANPLLQKLIRALTDMGL